jgi:hypothetical protein
VRLAEPDDLRGDWVRPTPGWQRSPPLNVTREGSRPCHDRSGGFHCRGGYSRSEQGKSRGSLEDATTVRCAAAMSSPSGGTPSAVMPTAPKAGDAEHDAVRCGGPLGLDAACASGGLHGGGHERTTTLSSSRRCAAWHLTMIGRVSELAVGRGGCR